MDDVKLIVDIHLTEAKTITSVAKMLKIPPETLRKKFLREEGIHLNEYIHQRKVQAMKELLLNSDEPCFAVCYNVGFREDTGAKVFKKIAGMTMQEFRRKYKNKYERLKSNSTKIKQLHQILAEALCIDLHTEEQLEKLIQQKAKK